MARKANYGVAAAGISAKEYADAVREGSRSGGASKKEAQRAGANAHKAAKRGGAK